MGIEIRHQPDAAPYAQLALNAGVGQLLEKYAEYIQPERLQQRGFQQQNQQQQFDFFANSALGQQRAQQQAELQRQQNLQGLESNLIRGVQQQQFGVQNQLLGGTINSALLQQRGQQQYGLADLDAQQRIEAIKLQDDLLRGRQETQFDDQLFATGVRDQDLFIRKFRAEPGFQQMSLEDRNAFEGSVQKRNALMTDRSIRPAQKAELLRANFDEIAQRITLATKTPDPETQWNSAVLWKQHPDTGVTQPWVRNHNGEWQIARGYKDATVAGEKPLDPIKVQQQIRQVQADRTTYVSKMLGLLKMKDVNGAESYPNGMGPIEVMGMLEQDAAVRYPMPTFSQPTMPGNAPQPTRAQLGLPAAAPPRIPDNGHESASLVDQFRRQPLMSADLTSDGIAVPPETFVGPKQPTPSEAWVDQVTSLGRGDKVKNAFSRTIGQVVDLAVGGMDLTQPIPTDQLAFDKQFVAKLGPVTRQQLERPAVKQAISTINTLRKQYGGRVLPPEYHLDYVKASAIMVLGYNPTPANDDEVKQVPSGELYRHWKDGLPRRRK